MPELNQLVENITLPATGGGELGIADFKGSNLVLYFYPKDNTPGCSRESKAFRDHHEAFQQLNTAIVGVSRDSRKSHENFRSKHELPFDLLADTDERLCDYFSVIKHKNMYGRKVRGIERSTFLIDANSILRREWRGVKVAGHVEQVLAAAREL